MRILGTKAILPFSLSLSLSLQDRSNAQSSCAGLFIGAHLGFEYPGKWIHLDMASPVYSVGYVTHCGLNLIQPRAQALCVGTRLNLMGHVVQRTAMNLLAS